MGTRKIRTAAGRESALDAATQLLAEREKYEQWLEDLEDKKDSTPAKVFDRVRQDYVARLQSVMEQLEEHTATLQEHAENLMTKLRELEDAEEENNEAQEEAAVRKQVGEITSAEWESGSRKAQRELAKIKENQTVILADLNRIRSLLGGEEEEEAPPAGKSSKDFNELEFLSSVVGTGSHPTPNPPAPAIPAKAPPTGPRATPSAAPVTRQTPTGTPAPRSTPTGTPASAPAATPAPAPPPAAATPEPVIPAVTETPASGTPNQPRKSAMAEQPKTLKCQECGTMNLPSEWYCERCGAEMTVV
jgi:chaperonin cofactor prefoldin